ncbi:MAG: ribonuclease P protein component [Elusimicrobia bacterium]|nr:ribonuclease P protein component [Elusimicrobiota bacterium]
MERLFFQRDFQRVLDSGRRWTHSDVLVWSLSQPARTSVRLGIMVSRRLGNAVLRNRLKRLVREVFRLNKASLNKGVDLVVYPKPGCAWKNFKQAEQTLLNLWKRARIFQACRS